MRYIKYALIASFAVFLIAVALANRQIVSIQLIPAEVADWFAMNPQTQLPLFVIIFGGIIVGLFVGFVWEWIREHKHRAEAAQKRREAAELRREVAEMRNEKAEGDEVLAILEETR